MVDIGKETYENNDINVIVDEMLMNSRFFRINPDEENFNIFKEINKIHRHIKKSTKKSLINDLSKILQELEFKPNHSIKSKCLKWIVKKNTTYNIKT